ncbi:hypothetical protein ACIP10_00965 [Streptomyces galbus]|uniref:hypothetical protein n=1 Tax=Streptomyces galbus TaxID=33898 RepID=UPI0037974F5A
MDHDLVTGGTQLDRGTHGLFLVPPVLLTVARFADASSLAQVGGWCAARRPAALPRRAAGRGVTAHG